MYDLNKIMEKEFDKNSNYKAILSQIEGVSIMKKFKYVFIPACAIIIMFAAIVLNKNASIPDIIIRNPTEENPIIELNINRIKDTSITSLDADIKILKMDDIPEKFKFIKTVNIPNEYKLENSYNIYIKSDINKADYNKLHDYVFEYRKDSMNKIIIAFSEIEQPLRDYEIVTGEQISKIGNVELIISQYQDMYIVTFSYNNIYFDIETTGITEAELQDLLVSIF